MASKNPPAPLVNHYYALRNELLSRPHWVVEDILASLHAKGYNHKHWEVEGEMCARNRDYKHRYGHSHPAYPVE